MSLSNFRRIFSGIQPTGVPHLGNYLGAIRHWVELQSENKNNDMVMFCIMDLHSYTRVQGSNEMKDNIFNMLASLLACGINPSQSLIFQQSQVSYHTELSWFLSCLTPVGRLTRMHQWKTKSKETKNDTNLGILSYPALMAADILLYKSTHVPVGDDQVQHMELTRDVATLFNKTYTYTFPVPETLLTSTPRISSLRDPTQKMSKSDINENSRINLNDSPDTITNKIRKAVTDSEPYISDCLDKRPGVRNLIEILSSLSGTSNENLINKYRNTMYFTAQLKKDVTDILISSLNNVRTEFNILSQDRNYLEKILVDGSFKANELAAVTMKEVFQKIGVRR
ncbi:tryptophan--tRNA ligase, mitochondrial isoform X2 [Hydra vulgaris]|uniref:tryptophan--tRNA ligase n=1 Tax=Hydra vulgaris TaxID=6087 RepID=A0ABM4BL95_HYDVU